jgi:hypothetical protein
LVALQRQHIERAANRERHTIYHNQWHEQLATIEQLRQQSAAQASTLAEREATITGYRGKLAELTAELIACRQQLRQARKRKSLPYRTMLHWRRLCCRVLR